MTCCSCFVVAFFLMKNVPLIVQKVWQEKKEAGDEPKKN
jgi:hypothetical protein